MRGNEKVIQELNAALSSELTAVVQYMTQSEMCQNWGYRRLANHTRGRAMEEMRHAEGLIERIIFLDAIPSVDVGLKPQLGTKVQDSRETLAAGGVKCLQLPARSPNLNAFAERWVRWVKEECLSKLILFGEASLKRALTEFQEHYHAERNHQGKGNKRLFPRPNALESPPHGTVRCQERLGGLLKYYERDAA